MKIFEVIAQPKQMDPDTYEDLDPHFIFGIAKKIVPSIKGKATGEGYAHLTTKDGLDLAIGANIHAGAINISIGTPPMRKTSSGPHKGAVTAIIKAVYDNVVQQYGIPTAQGSLTIDRDGGHGVWQHIANKLGLEYGAYNVQ